jgi:hypothetical protein
LEWTVLNTIESRTRLLLSKNPKDKDMTYGDRREILLELLVRGKAKKYIDLASESFMYSFYFFLKRIMAV